jgi:hypothetical protein
LLEEEGAVKVLVVVVELVAINLQLVLLVVEEHSHQL